MAIKDYLAKLRGGTASKTTDLELIRAGMKLSDLAMKHVDEVDEEFADLLARHPSIIREKYIAIIKEELPWRMKEHAAGRGAARG